MKPQKMNATDRMIAMMRESNSDCRMDVYYSIEEKPVFQSYVCIEYYHGCIDISRYKDEIIMDLSVMHNSVLNEITIKKSWLIDCDVYSSQICDVNAIGGEMINCIIGKGIRICELSNCSIDLTSMPIQF